MLAVIGTLSMLAEAASLAFLFTFAVVCALACARRGNCWMTGLGAPSRNGGDRGPDRGLARNEPLALAF